MSDDLIAEPGERGRLALVARLIEPSGRLLRAWAPSGGVSAQVTALEIARPDGQTRRLLVRRHGPADLRQNPRVAADELRLLGLLRAAGLPVPAPLHLDETGAIFPTPYIVVEYVEGTAECPPEQAPARIPQLAAQLAAIHRIDGARPELAFLPRQAERQARALDRRPQTLDESLGEGRIRAALSAAWPLAQRNAPALLHGDFWPGNVLWRDGRLVAVIDWEDAAIGDPLADLASSRLEILWALGAEAMGEFTRRYHALAGIDLGLLPYWDLCAALRPAGRLAGWGLDPATERRMRDQHGRFVAAALAALPGPG